MKKTISKSLALKAFQCLKAGYLERHHPELKSPITPEQQMTFDRGTEVGILARNLYPGGDELTCGNTVRGEALLQATRFALLSNQKTFYEPAFESSDGFYFQADILNRNRRRTRIIEVKSSTSVKVPTHVHDIGFQWRVLQSLGYDKSTELFIAYINNQFILHDEPNIEELFTLENVTIKARKVQPLIEKRLKVFKEVLTKSHSPNIDIGEHCHKPYPCQFMEHCRKHLPEYSIWDVGGLRKKKKSEIYSEGNITADQILSNVELKEAQRIEVNAAIDKKPHINKKKIKDFLSILELDKPIFYMDFESFMPAIPKFIGTRPYQQICFQYCVIYKNPLDAKLERREFLAEPGFDPRRNFIENLLKDTEGDGKIIVYNDRFEITRLKELGELFPEYSDMINERISRIKDLMVPFADKSYYHPSFKGSYKIKTVLPVLCPELSYSELEIYNGAIAMNKYEIFGRLTLKEQLETKKALKQYCYTDVLAMVRIIEALQQIISNQ